MFSHLPSGVSRAGRSADGRGGVDGDGDLGLDGRPQGVCGHNGHAHLDGHAQIGGVKAAEKLPPSAERLAAAAANV